MQSSSSSVVWFPDPSIKEPSQGSKCEHVGVQKFQRGPNTSVEFGPGVQIQTIAVFNLSQDSAHRL